MVGQIVNLVQRNVHARIQTGDAGADPRPSDRGSGRGLSGAGRHLVDRVRTEQAPGYVRVGATDMVGEADVPRMKQPFPLDDVLERQFERGVQRGASGALDQRLGHLQHDGGRPVVDMHLVGLRGELDHLDRHVRHAGLVPGERDLSVGVRTPRKMATGASFHSDVPDAVYAVSPDGPLQRGQDIAPEPLAERSLRLFAEWLPWLGWIR